MPLIGLAHGSRHPGVTPAIDRLLAAVAGTQGIETRAAYLDLVQPDLTAVAHELAAAGHRAAVVVPLLFTSAFHATVDVPQALAAASAATGLDLLQAEVLGTGPDVEAVLGELLGGIAPDAPVLLYAVGSSDAAANAAVHDLGRRLARTRSAQVAVGFGTVEPQAATVLPELERSGTGSVAILPLFLAPGLLLDPMLTLAAERNWPVVPPLADRAAPLVVQRYQDRARLPDHLR